MLNPSVQNPPCGLHCAQQHIGLRGTPKRAPHGHLHAQALRQRAADLLLREQHLAAPEYDHLAHAVLYKRGRAGEALDDHVPRVKDASDRNLQGGGPGGTGVARDGTVKEKLY